MSEYYVWLSSLLNLVGGPLRDLDGRLGIPAATALLLGLIGSTSPCQLTTSATALAFVSRDAPSTRRLIGSAAAYLMGKVVVYTVLGLLVAAVGLELSRAAVPVAVAVRKGMGPLLIAGGLVMLGVLELPSPLGRGLGGRLEDAARRGRRFGPFLLGAAFSFAFCPTLFWLFFGLLLPLSLTSPTGVVYPGLFALGTALPFLALVSLLAAGLPGLGRHVREARGAGTIIRGLSGVVFIVTGLNEVVLYWIA